MLKNVESYLKECLDSVQKQTFDDFEVILADDGSTDKSGNICDEYAKNDMRFKVLHLENGGAVRARRTALHASSGDYIVFADSDDLLDIGLLERLREAVLREAPDIVAFGYQLFDAGGVLLKNKNAPRAGVYEGKRLKKVQKALIYDKRQRSFNYGSVIYSLWSKAWRAEFLREHEVLLKVESAGLHCQTLFAAAMNATPETVLHRRWSISAFTSTS